MLLLRYINFETLKNRSDEDDDSMSNSSEESISDDHNILHARLQGYHGTVIMILEEIYRLPKATLQEIKPWLLSILLDLIICDSRQLRTVVKSILHVIL